jgi:DNA-directed RNA polymerase specialized sigma24 family protein
VQARGLVQGWVPAWVRPSCRPMLSGTFSLHGIEDVEAFCASFLQRSKLEPPPPWTTEDFLADLVSYVWELSISGDYDPSRGSFSTFARTKLYGEAVNWIRRKKGRTKWQFKDRVHERRLPSFIALDDRPEQADPASTVDAGSDRLSDLSGLFGTRSSASARRARSLGQEETRQAA